MSQNKQVAAAIARVPHLDLQELKTLRENALRYGENAAALVHAIDARLADFDAAGGLAHHRLEFARQMLRIVERGQPRQWQEGRSVFNKAVLKNGDNPFVVWMKGNTARQIPITKALQDVLPEFPHIERDKDVQSGRVSWRRRGKSAGWPTEMRQKRKLGPGRRAVAHRPCRQNAGFAVELCSQGEAAL